MDLHADGREDRIRGSRNHLHTQGRDRIFEPFVVPADADHCSLRLTRHHVRTSGSSLVRGGRDGNIPRLVCLVTSAVWVFGTGKFVRWLSTETMVEQFGVEDSGIEERGCEQCRVCGRVWSCLSRRLSRRTRFNNSCEVQIMENYSVLLVEKSRCVYDTDARVGVIMVLLSMQNK